MILLLLAAVAGAEPGLEERLLGDAPVAVPAVSAPASSGSGFGLLLGLVAIGAGLYAWRRESKAEVAGPMRVLSQRTVPNGSLLVVEVDGFDGGQHRLLVGTGSSGPRLLADITIGLTEDPQEMIP